MTLANSLPSVVQPPTIQFNPQGAPTPPDLAVLRCPNCGSADPKSLVLTVDVQLPDNPAKRLRVLRCPACTAHFYDSQVPPDYAEPALNDRGRVPFYVQQGAGVSLITKPIAQLRRTGAATYMEVGCGYGFSLDFALNTRGWTGIGIDPAPLAALGRDALQLPIELRYLRDDDEARGTMDVVMGSEVIEHVPSPEAFVRTLRAMLRPGGVLLLTTPNGDDIEPSTPPGIIIPLLSPSLHLVIQSRTSLERLLRLGGFQHVQVEIDSHSLVAFASDSPLELEHDHAVLRRALRDHLARRAASVPPGSDLCIGFAGRALAESVNDGAMDDADRAWAVLEPAVSTRYGFGLGRLGSLPEELATCSLERMAELVPLNLASILYARALRDLAAGTPRRDLERPFRLAAQAAAAMRRALGELAMEDGQTEDIGWTARAEALLCAADAEAPDLDGQLAALPPAPNGGEARRQEIVGRALGQLVNAGQYERARSVLPALHTSLAALAAHAAPLTPGQRDLLFSMAVLQLQRAPDTAAPEAGAVRAAFARVRAESTPGDGVWWAAVEGERNATEAAQGKEASLGFVQEMAASGHDGTARWAVCLLANAAAYEPARAIAVRSGLFTAPLGQQGTALSEQDRQTVFALATLNVQPRTPGGPPQEAAAARRRFAQVRASGTVGDGLWWAALHGEAQAITATSDIAALTELAEAAVAQTQKTSPEAWSRARDWAIVALVNAGAYPAARRLAAVHALFDAPFAAPASERPLAATERDVVFALAMLDVQPADGTHTPEPAMARGRFARVRAAATPGDGLWWSALRGETLALDRLDAREEATRLLREAASAHPALPLPPDLASRLGG